MTVFNYETGFVHIVIIGAYILVIYIQKKVNLKLIALVYGMLLLPVVIYSLMGIYYASNPFPILSMRVNFTETNIPGVIQRERLSWKGYTESKLQDVENVSGSLLADNDELTIMEMRSTYAPRTLKVLAIRTVDIVIDIMNLSFIERIIKDELFKNVDTRERENIKKRIFPYLAKLFMYIGVVVILLLPFLIIFLLKNINVNTVPMIVVLFVTVTFFVVILNRVDLSNAVAMLSSIIFADLILNLLKKRMLIAKYFGIGMVLLVISGSVYNMSTGFYAVYPFDKEVMHSHHKIYENINKKIGHLSTKSIVYVNYDSILSHPAMSAETPMPQSDLSHSNVSFYRNEFFASELSNKYSGVSIQDFQEAPEIRNTISALLVHTKDDAFKYNQLFNYEDAIYVDEHNNVSKLID